jgi:uncharacterized protein YjiS (DUF1127 family)
MIQASPLQVPALASQGGIFHNAMIAIRRRASARRAWDALERLSDRDLADIGLTRSQIPSAAHGRIAGRDTFPSTV